MQGNARYLSKRGDGEDEIDEQQERVDSNYSPVRNDALHVMAPKEGAGWMLALWLKTAAGTAP